MVVLTPQRPQRVQAARAAGRRRTRRLQAVPSFPHPALVVGSSSGSGSLAVRSTTCSPVCLPPHRRPAARPSTPTASPRGRQAPAPWATAVGDREGVSGAVPRTRGRWRTEGEGEGCAGRIGSGSAQRSPPAPPRLRLPPTPAARLTPSSGFGPRRAYGAGRRASRRVDTAPTSAYKLLLPRVLPPPRPRRAQGDRWAPGLESGPAGTTLADLEAAMPPLA